MDGHGYGSVVCNRPFRARSVSFIWQEDHESTENLLAVSESRRVLREKLGEPIFAGYVTNVKSRFFSLGLVLGASLQMFMVSIVLMVVACYSNHAGPLVELSHEYYPVFRCMFHVTLFFTLYGADLFIWRRAAIDYKTILGVSPHHSYQYVIRGSASMAYIVFSCFLLYVLTITGMLRDVGEVDSLKHLWPALAVFLPMLLFVCPSDRIVSPCFGSQSHGYQQRLGFIRNALAVLGTPFTETTFLRSFIADIFCSMPKIFNDMEYTACLYVTGSFWDRPNEWTDETNIHGYYKCGGGSAINKWLTRFLSFVPFLIRFLQVMRAYRDTNQTKNLFNGVKYILCMSMASLAIARSVYREDDASSTTPLDLAWIIVSSITTLYAFFWDTVMDWGLFECIWGTTRSTNVNVHRPWMLRETMYFTPRVYYFAVCGNFVMRLGWAFLISPEQPYVKQNYILLLGSVELFRRSVWAIFRIEYEDVERNKIPQQFDPVIT